MNENEREISKIKNSLTRAQREVAKIDIEIRKCRAERRWLPDAYPSWEQAEQFESFIPAKEFVRIRDQQTFEQVYEALQANKLSKVFDLLSDVFHCDRSEICLLEDRVVTRKGEKVPVVYFRYTYNPSFNDLLKEIGNAKGTGKARFDASLKAWNMDLDDYTKDAVALYIGGFYRIVIDLNRMVILQNAHEPEMSAPKRVAFLPLPFHIKIEKSKVIEAILSSRPSDFICRLYVHDGSCFVPYPEQEVFFTKSPFLLFRYAVNDGKPRYVSFSTLGMAVEYMSFGNESKKTTMAIARFMDTCRALRLPAIEIQPNDLMVETETLRIQLQGGFDRFSKSIETIHSVIPDMGFAPLCSDYVTLLSQDYGAESALTDIEAYVMPMPSRNEHYVTRIAEFFGYTPDDYPVIFTRSVLDNWNDQEDYYFLFTAAHELAHYLAFEAPCPKDHDKHGIVWAVCQDLLEYLFVGEYSMTGYDDYHADDLVTIRKIEYAVNNIGIPMLENIRLIRPLSKDDIKTVACDCVADVHRVMP